MLPIDDEQEWLARFHDGRREVLEAVYRDHLSTVDGAVGRLLGAADRETVVQEVFLRLLSNEGLRQSFRGGSLPAWLATVARNHAIDFLRRQQREVALDEDHLGAREADVRAHEADRKLEARMLVDRFRNEHLPDKWRGVFEARFIEQLDQREAAKRLGMHRTTLAYQELRIRGALRRFLVGGEVT